MENETFSRVRSGNVPAFQPSPDHDYHITLSNFEIKNGRGPEYIQYVTKSPAEVQIFPYDRTVYPLFSLISVASVRETKQRINERVGALSLNLLPDIKSRIASNLGGKRRRRTKRRRRIH